MFVLVRDALPYSCLLDIRLPVARLHLAFWTLFLYYWMHSIEVLLGVHEQIPAFPVL